MEKKNNDIVEMLMADNTVERMSRHFHIHPYYRQDLVQEVYLAILQTPRKKLLDLLDNNQLRYWVYGVVRNNYNRGPFYRRWRQYDQRKTDMEKIMYKI